MTTKQDLDRMFPSMNQIGGEHYKLKIQPYTFIMENNLNFFQGNVIKYVVRYQKKGGAQDLEKIIHYCELELERMRECLKEKK
ncbi:MAG: DUF3310 domain-containing protein [Candidatus Neomarinimicrobiota bacterium]